MRSSGAPPEAPPAPSSAGQDPHSIAARMDLARSLLARGALDESERLLRQLLNETPALAQAHALVGGIHIQRQQWRQGAVVLRRALELDPSLVAAHIDLATCLFNQLRSEEAHAHLQQAIRLAPSNALIRAAQVVRRLPLVARTIEESSAAAGAFESAVSDYGA